MLVVLALVFSNCTNNQEEPFIPEITQKEQNLVESSNTFGFGLFDQVVSEKADQNVFVSPLSVSIALGMAYNGAKGETATAMQTTLGYEGLSQLEINQGYLTLLQILTNLDPKVTMEIANSVWCRLGIPFLADFIERLEDFFAALVSELDFSAPGAANTINNWVAESTHDKIEKIVDDPISDHLVMFLINAIYFKGDWTYQFDKKDTYDGEFNTLSGTKTVPTMHLHQELDYVENEDFQAVSLPYGDGFFSMMVILPKPEKDIDSLISEMSPENWITWQSQLVSQEGYLYLPKFELEFEASLKEVLKAMGMEIAFNEIEADFTGMSPLTDLFISDVKHKTYVKVDEEGTEAAAVTSVEVGITSMPEGFQMRVDRPFIFVIFDKHTDALLFMGKIVEPK
jgi:serpin B